ncbi:MAG: hypothetical protein ACLQJR_07395 [Stellaceae bacterium]
MFTQSSFAQAVLCGASKGEPALDDLLADPIVQLLMSSDRVYPAYIRQVLQAAKEQQKPPG